MKGLLFYINKILGKTPTKKEKSFARRELDYFMKGRGATGRFLRKGERFKRLYKEKKIEKIGDTEIIGRFYRIVDDEDE